MPCCTGQTQGWLNVDTVGIGSHTPQLGQPPKTGSPAPQYVFPSRVLVFYSGFWSGRRMWSAPQATSLQPSPGCSSYMVAIGSDRYVPCCRPTGQAHQLLREMPWRISGMPYKTRPRCCAWNRNPGSPGTPPATGNGGRQRASTPSRQSPSPDPVSAPLEPVSAWHIVDHGAAPSALDCPRQWL